MAEVEYDDEGMVQQGFDHIRVYDAPMVALSQMFENEASWKSIKNTFLDPSALSPSERDSFSGSLKESLGNNPLTNAVLDIALNPFVWMLALTTPAAASALKSGGRVFTGLAKSGVDVEGKQYFKYLMGNYSPLRFVGGLNAHQMGAGTPLNPIIQSMQNRINQLVRQDTQGHAPQLGEVLGLISKKFGTTVRGLDPEQAQRASAVIDGATVTLKEYLKKFNAYGYIHMAGMAGNSVRTVSSIGGRRYLKFNREGVRDSNFLELSSKDAEFFSDSHALSNNLEMDIAYLRKKNASPTEIRKHQSFLEGKRKSQQRKLESLLKKQGIGLNEGELVSFHGVSPIAAEGATKFHIAAGGHKSILKVHRDSRSVKGLDPDGLADKWLKQEGFMPLLDQSRVQMKNRYIEMFGDVEHWDRTGVLKYDEDKLARIWYSLSSVPNRADKVQMSTLITQDLVGEMDGKVFKMLINAFEKGGSTGKNKIEFTQFKNLLKELREGDDLNNYMPRNMWSQVTREGDRVKWQSFRNVKLARLDKREAQVSGRGSERRKIDPVVDSRDLQILKGEYDNVGSSNAHLDNEIQKSKTFEFESPPQREDNVSSVMNLDFMNSFNKYLHQTRNDIALHIDRIDAPIINAVNGPLGEAVRKIRRPPSDPATKRAKYRPYANRYEALKWTAESLRQSDGGLGNSSGGPAADYIMGTLLERLQGNMPLKDMISEYATVRAKETATWLAKSKFFTKVGEQNETADKFIKNLKHFGEQSVTETSSSAAGRGLTKLFYASHLGMNLGSASLNLMQPLMYAANWMEPDVMATAYGQAIKQYFKYIQARVKLGVHADPIDVDNLRAKSFRLSNVGTKDYPKGLDLLDIRKTDFERIDQQAFHAVSGQKPSRFEFWTSEAPLKLFTHTELFNRLVTGEAMLAQSIKAGRVKGLGKITEDLSHPVIAGSDPDYLLSENVRSMVQNTQFGSDIVNSPKLFQDSGWGLPWVRQFFTFPTRTLTAWTDTAPMINQGRRTWGMTGFESQGRYSAMAHDLMRSMGLGALVYEVGKNVAGVDLSRGLAAQTLYESTIVGPSLVEGNENFAYNMPMPPAADILFDVTAAITDEDKSLFGALAPRFVPGGIALSRALGVAPPLFKKSGWGGGLQRYNADWGAQNQEGQIPIYREDGSLMEYRSAARTVLGGLGFDSYMFKNDRALNKFLIANRQEIVDGRRKYLDAVLGNDLGKAARLKAEFEKRFKFPLSISKAQIDGAIQLREVPLKERMYQRLTPAFRPQVRPYLAERLETLKSRTPEELDLSIAQKMKTLPETFGADPNIYDFITD